MTPEQTQEITRLRGLNLSPKQIARKLSLRPAEVMAVIRAQAESAEVSRLEHLGDNQASQAGLPRLVQCLINEGAARRLLNTDQRLQQPDINPKSKGPESDEPGAGMANIFMARASSSDQYLFSGFLVDYWCLGVKDAILPQKMSKSKFERLIQQTQQKSGEPMCSITLQQAQSIVFGAVDYAAELGFKPHRDFEQAKTILGVRCETLPELKFGRNERPFYRSGISENPIKVLQTLRKNVGEDNFDFIADVS